MFLVLNDFTPLLGNIKLYYRDYSTFDQQSFIWWNTIYK